MAKTVLVGHALALKAPVAVWTQDLYALLDCQRSNQWPFSCQVWQHKVKLHLMVEQCNHSCIHQYPRMHFALVSIFLQKSQHQVFSGNGPTHSGFGPTQMWSENLHQLSSLQSNADHYIQMENHLGIFLVLFLHFMHPYFGCIFAFHPAKFQLHFYSSPQTYFELQFSILPWPILATFFHFIWNYFWSHFCISSRHIFCHFSGFHPPNFQINFQISEYSIKPDDLYDMFSFQLFPITPKSLVSHLATLWPFNRLQFIINSAS